MWRSTFNPNDSSWNASAEKLRTAEQERAYQTEDWPTPGELFFETGVVLAIALGVSFVAQLLIGTP